MRPSSSSSARPRSGSGPPISWRSSTSWRSPAGLGGARGLGAGERDGRGVDLELELGREPRRAQQPQRVGGEAALADHAQEPPLEVGEAAVRVDRRRRRRAARRPRRREVALGEVGLDRLAAQRGRRRPARRRRGRRRARCANSAESSKACPPPLAAIAFAAARGVAGDGEVEVGDLAAERRVADRAAGDPDVARRAARAPSRASATDAAPRRGDRRGSRARSRSRGTRAEIPQVTS